VTKTTAEKPSGSPQGEPEMSAANTSDPHQEAAGLAAANTSSLPSHAFAHTLEHLLTIAEEHMLLEGAIEDSLAGAAEDASDTDSTTAQNGDWSPDDDSFY
jgi:hypothetical protein